MVDKPVEFQLMCEFCNSNDYHPAALMMYADRVVSPNTYWWWHFPKTLDIIAVRCNAHSILEYNLIGYVIEGMIKNFLLWHVQKHAKNQT